MGDTAAFDLYPTTPATGPDAPMGAACVRAGPWLFLTGHHAADPVQGVSADVTGNPALPLHGLHRFRREGATVLDRLNRLLGEQGSDFSHAVRLDQYYPTWRAVDPYHQARKAAFTSFIPPSTSVLMEELLVPACAIDVSLMAVTRESGMAPRRSMCANVQIASMKSEGRSRRRVSAKFPCRH